MLINRVVVIRSHFLQTSFLAGCCMLTGCTTLDTYFNREIQENQIEADDEGYQGSIMGMTATRRGVVIRAATKAEIAMGKPQLLFCAEPPPDAMQSIQAALEVSLKNKAAEGQAAQKYATAVAGIAARTPISETYRTAVFSLCQLNINGSIDNAQTARLFEAITQEAFEALKAAAGKEQLAPAASSIVTAANTTAPAESVKEPIKDTEKK